MPGLRTSDFTDVPADGAGDGIVVCGGVYRVRRHASNGEMAVFHVPAADSDGDGFACAAAAGRGQLAGLCGRTHVFSVCAAGPWVGSGYRGEIPAGAIAGVRSRNSRRDSWRGFWKLFALGHGGRIQNGARPRRHGHGRRENDGHDRSVSRVTGNLSDASGGESAGQRDRTWPYRGSVPHGLEERRSQTREPQRTGDAAPIAMGDCEAVPVAAGDVSGNWSAGNRVWGTSDRGAMANFQGNRRLTKRTAVDCKKQIEKGKKRKKEKKKTQRRGEPQRRAKEKREETDVRNAAKCKQHAAPLDYCRGTGSWVPGGRGAGGVFDAEVFSAHAGGERIQNGRAANRESFGVHGGLDARGHSATARTGKGTGTTASHRERARGADGAAERRSNEKHAGGSGGGERHGNYFQLESGGGAGAGNSRAGIPALQRGARGVLGLDEVDYGVPFDRENFPARRGGTYPARGRHAMLGRDDLADPERRRKDQRRDLHADGFDGTERAPATDAIEGKPGRAGRTFCGNRARVQERAGDDFGLRADDPVGVHRGGGSRLRETHPGADAEHHARGDGVLEVRAAAGK